VLLASSWRSENAILLCSDEDDSLSRLPAPVDAPLGASLTLYDCDPATGRVLVGASSLSQSEALYVGELRLLREGQTVAIGANFLPICIVHKDGSAYEGSEEAGEEDLDVAYAQIRYTRVLDPAEPLHPEAARRLRGARMEVLQVPVPPEQTYPDGGAQLPFEAVLLTPGFDAAKEPLPPLLAFPHGGPHGVSPTSFSNHLAFYAVCGFSVLLINYRGSTGMGQAALASLPGKCGSQDVADCLAAVELVASRTGKERVCSRDNIHIQGGSHGGFLTTHLIGQAPDLFQTAVARNPVCNIAHMIGTSDM
jgi:acylaminoacyl-peptidase